MASKTFKVNVDLDSKSLSKLKKTLSDARIKVDEKSIASLENAMASLESELDRNSEHLNVLTNAIESMGSGKGGGDLMGGAKSAAAGGATGILSEIRDLLEANGARLKSLADTNESGFNEAAHTRLKQLSRSQLTLDDQLKTKRIWMRGMMGGGKNPIGSALMGMGSAIFGKLADASSDVFKYQTAQDQGKMDTKSPTFNSQSEETKKEQAGGLIGSFEKTQKRAEGKFGKALGKLGGGKGMKIAGGIGMGAMAGGAIVKKGMQALIESSPMLKQMMKMLNFGVMMILRPLGDFFGFFLRPIFIYLLRKFIIPFYQTYLPIMQQMGHDLGVGVVGWLEAIANLMGWLSGEARGAEAGGIANLPSEEVQIAQLAKLAEMKEAGILSSGEMVRELQLLEMQLDPSNAKFWLAGSDPRDKVEEFVGTGNGTPVDPTTKPDYRDTGSGTFMDDTNTKLDDILKETENTPVLPEEFNPDILNQNLIPDPEPEMTATDILTYNQRQHSTDPPVYNITVEGNMDETVWEEKLKPKMEEVARQESEDRYNKDNRKR